MTIRYRLKAAEQRALDAAMEKAAPQAKAAFDELIRLDGEIRASVPPEAQGEASRAWINYILRRLGSQTDTALL